MTEQPYIRGMTVDHFDTADAIAIVCEEFLENLATTRGVVNYLLGERVDTLTPKELTTSRWLGNSLKDFQTEVETIRERWLEEL